MSKICEFFGYNTNDESMEYNYLLSTQLCPYTNNICSKSRKSDPQIKIGTCSVNFLNNKIIICPNRLLEKNTIFKDCIPLLTYHQPENDIFIIPEVKIPGGFVDYFLISAKNGNIIDFLGIEIQTVDTIGTLWPERQTLLMEKGILPSMPINKKPFAMNWKMTLKTILLQIYHKSKYFESINKHLVLVLQQPLYTKMKCLFDFKDVNSINYDDSIHIHSYDFLNSNSSHLLLMDTLSINSEGIEKSLGLGEKSNINYDDFIKILKKKIQDSHAININKDK